MRKLSVYFTRRIFFSITKFSTIIGIVFVTHVVSALAQTGKNFSIYADKSSSHVYSYIDTQLLCSKEPELASAILNVGRKLGIEVISGEPKLKGKDATYEAMYGKLGTITLRDRTMSLQVYCQLITHEFIHVLQHLNADLQGVEPLGWPLNSDSINYYGSLQEAEAYTYQNHAGRVLNLLVKALQKSSKK